MGTTEMTKPLTSAQCTLLQRYYDTDPLPDVDVSTVEELLNSSSAARVFMGALEELTIAVQAAEEEIWDRADVPSAASMVEMATHAAELADAPLEELAPLLERFFDAEVVAEEMIAVQALINERDDVAEYLANLDGLRASVRVGTELAVDKVSFDGFFDAIEAQIEEEMPGQLRDVEPVEPGGYDAEQHRVLLYRYHDGEATAEEIATVDGWLATGEAEVVATLGALSEIRMATVAAVETAQERVDFSDFWHHIEEQIDDEVESQGENVVSLARQKRERPGEAANDNKRAAAWVAIAAMLLAAFGIGTMQDQLFGGGERVVVEKTVVIVDSVEYEPGSSVMVNAPMKAVSSVSAAEGPNNKAQVEEEPTVIWLLDTGGEAAPAGDGNVEEGSGEEAEPKTEETSDQPI